MKLLCIENAKTTKGRKYGYETAILYLAPHKIAGPNICSDSTSGCRASCLFSAGMGIFSNVKQARIRKTKLFHEHKSVFLAMLDKDIAAFKRYARRKRRKPCIRLNGTSDLPFEEIFPVLFDKYPKIQFYDYSKSISRMSAFMSGAMPANYYLTFSLSEDKLNQAFAQKILDEKLGTVVAVVQVKKKEDLPRRFMGAKVVDGDLSDLRFLDRKGSVVLVRSKGKARYNKTGFVKEI